MSHTPTLEEVQTYLTASVVEDEVTSFGLNASQLSNLDMRTWRRLHLDLPPSSGDQNISTSGFDLITDLIIVANYPVEIKGEINDTVHMADAACTISAVTPAVVTKDATTFPADASNLIFIIDAIEDGSWHFNRAKSRDSDTQYTLEFDSRVIGAGLMTRIVKPAGSPTTFTVRSSGFASHRSLIDEANLTVANLETFMVSVDIFFSAI